MHILLIHCIAPWQQDECMGKLKRVIMSLEVYPQRHNFLQKDVWKIRQIRCMPIAHFLLFYIVDEQEKICFAHRI